MNDQHIVLELTSLNFALCILLEISLTETFYTNMGITYYQNQEISPVY